MARVLGCIVAGSLALAAAPQEKQDGVAALKERIRSLEQELAEATCRDANSRTLNRALDARLKDMESRYDALAGEVHRMRQILKTLDAPVTSGHVPASAPPEPKGFNAPRTPIRGVIRAISAEFQFVILNVGELQGVQPGYRFEVARDNERLAVLEIERFADPEKKMSKAKILEGDVNKLKVGDAAIAFRVGSPGTAEENAKPAEAPPAPKVSGRVNDAYMLTLGGKDGAEIGRRVWIYRDHALRGVLKLDYVDNDWSLAKRIDDAGGSDTSIVEGDQISLREIGPALAGRIHFSSDSRGIYVDLGSRDGARAGQRFAVTRLGERIGEIVLQDVKEHFSTASPAAGCSADTFQRNDFVEIIP